MCHLELAVREGDSLYIHGIPHPELLEIIVTMGVDQINALYQK